MASTAQGEPSADCRLKCGVIKRKCKREVMRRVLALAPLLLLFLFAKTAAAQVQLTVNTNVCPNGGCHAAQAGDGVGFTITATISNLPQIPGDVLCVAYSGDPGTIGVGGGCSLAGGLIVYDTPGTKTLTVTVGLTKNPPTIPGSDGLPPFPVPYSLPFDFEVGSATASFTILPRGGQPPSQFQISPAALNFPGPLLPISVPDGGGSIGTPLVIKLGQHLSLQYISVDTQTGTTTVIPAQFSFDSQTPADLGNLSGIFANPTRLFPNTVLLHFTAPSPDEFFAIHSGTAVLDITPTDSSLGAPRVSLTVNVPSCSLGQPCGLSLGTFHTEFDDDIVRFADFRGIPPQIVKAHIDREARVLPATGQYDPESFRYEPLSYDFDSVSFGQDLRTDPRFAPYRLRTFADDIDRSGLSQGADLTDVDIRPRRKYSVQLVGANQDPLLRVLSQNDSPFVRRINPEDFFVTMENILYTNNKQHARENWGSVPGGARRFLRFIFYQRQQGSPFVGQTVIASSYGLMQIMYPTAVDPFGYTDAKGLGLPPQLLFQQDTSLDLGTEVVSRGFRKRLKSLVDRPQFHSFQDLLDGFKLALRDYNASRTYPDEVSARIGQFPPR